MSPLENKPEECDVPDGILCVADKVATSDSGLDHADALGYSGAAFRIHALPREVLCPSTVSPRFGYKPPTVDLRSHDTVSALRQAKMLAEAGQFGEYVSGQAAYDLWIQLLRAEDEGGWMRQQVKAHSVEDAGLPILNTYCFLSLLHTRQAAGPFLRRRASELKGTASRYVEEAAARYDHVTRIFGNIDKPAWTSEARQKQAVAMQEAKELEKQAAVLLSHALADIVAGGSAQEP